MPGALRIGGRVTSRPNFLHMLGRAGPINFAVKTRNKCRASPAGEIHHVDGVALVNEVIGPAWPAVWSLQPRYVGLSASRLHEQNWITMPDLLRYPDFHIHGATHSFLAWLSHPLL